MVSKSLNRVTEKKLKITYRILKYPAHTRIKPIIYAIKNYQTCKEAGKYNP